MTTWRCAFVAIAFVVLDVMLPHRLDSAVPWPYYPSVEVDTGSGRVMEALTGWRAAGMVPEGSDVGTGSAPYHPLFQPIVPVSQRTTSAPVAMVRAQDPGVCVLVLRINLASHCIAAGRSWLWDLLPPPPPL